MDEQKPLTTTAIEDALIKIEKQRTRMQPKLDHANRMFEQKLRELQVATAGLKRWNKRCRYYARQLALANAGMLINKPKRQPKPRRAIDI